MTRLQNAWRTVAFCAAFGQSLTDKARLINLALKHIRVNRGWASYRFDVSEVGCKFNGKALRLALRDNGVDIGVVLNIFLDDACKDPTSDYEPKVICDLGANIGMAGVYFASVYPHLRTVYGFEPEKSNCQVSQQNYARNVKSGNVFELAVGGSDTEALFTTDTRDTQGHSLTNHWALKVDDAYIKQVKVKVRSLNSMVASGEIAPPDFLKIDVEGAEYDVLTGLGDAQHTVRKMFIETHSGELHQRCRTWLEENGFKILSESRPPKPNAIGAIWTGR